MLVRIRVSVNHRQPLHDPTAQSPSHIKHDRVEVLVRGSLCGEAVLLRYRISTVNAIPCIYTTPTFRFDSRAPSSEYRDSRKM